MTYWFLFFSFITSRNDVVIVVTSRNNVANDVLFWNIRLFTSHCSFFFKLCRYSIRKNILLMLVRNCCNIKSDVLFMYDVTFITWRHRDAWCHYI